MGRYTGPVEKLSRREGVELFLKGERALNGKSGLERRGPAPPGQHGTRRGSRPSIYANQLRAKQRAKRYYGVRVDGRRVDRASYLVKPGQEIGLDDSSPVRPLAVANTELTPSVAPWLQADFESLSGTVLRLPNRNEIAAPVDEHLIVELYSRL